VSGTAVRLRHPIGGCAPFTLVLALAAVLFDVPLIHAQDAQPDNIVVTPFFRDVTRVETWSFFDPGPDGGNPDYSFIGNRMSFGVGVSTPRWEAAGTFQYIQLFRLPQAAIGPGALGSGGYYFYSAGNRNAYQFYAHALNFGFKSAAKGLRIRGGRMGYTSGAEGDSGVASLEHLKRERLDSRLIGEFEWSIIQRAFDGVRVDVDRRGWRLTGAALMPTQGGYEESASPTITKVQLYSAAATFKPHVVIPWSELQFFSHTYRDRREVETRPDNSPFTATQADITVSTFGASQAGIFPTVAGEVDSVVWLAGQAGRWYGDPHRAWSLAAEIGHRWTAIPWQPWVRAGLLYASGDSDPTDARHGTFFQMLPTSRRYSLSNSYAQMNMKELFGQVYLYPASSVTLRADVHRLSLADPNDRWYAGSGATARTAVFFGYSMRPSNAATSLGTVIEGSAEVKINRYWSVNGYLGHIAGGDVVKRLFVGGSRLTFFYVENVIGF
jgi:hypothetical protein